MKQRQPCEPSVKRSPRRHVGFSRLSWERFLRNTAQPSPRVVRPVLRPRSSSMTHWRAARASRHNWCATGRHCSMTLSLSSPVVRLTAMPRAIAVSEAFAISSIIACSIGISGAQLLRHALQGGYPDYPVARINASLGVLFDDLTRQLGDSFEFRRDVARACRRPKRDDTYTCDPP